MRHCPAARATPGSRIVATRSRCIERRSRSPASPGICRCADDLFVGRSAGAESAVERADLYNVRDVRLHRPERPRQEAFQWGLKGLRSCSASSCPSMIQQPATARELAAIQTNLRGRTPAQLLEAPQMRAAEQLACMDLLSTLSDAVYFHRPELFPFVTARMVNLSLEHGNAVSSAPGVCGLRGVAGCNDPGLPDGTRVRPPQPGPGGPVRRSGSRDEGPGDVRDLREQLDGAAAHVVAADSGRAASGPAGRRHLLRLGLQPDRDDHSLAPGDGARPAGGAASCRRSSVYRKARYQRASRITWCSCTAIRTLQGMSLQADDIRAAGTAAGRAWLSAGAGRSGAASCSSIRSSAWASPACCATLGGPSTLSNAVAGDLHRVPRFVQHVEHNFYTSLTLAARCGRASAEDRSNADGGHRGQPGAAGPVGEKQPRELRAQTPDRRGRAGAPGGRRRSRPPSCTTGPSRPPDENGSSRTRRWPTSCAVGFTWPRAASASPPCTCPPRSDAYARWGAKAKVDALEAEFVDVLVSADRMRAPGERGPDPRPDRRRGPGSAGAVSRRRGRGRRGDAAQDCWASSWRCAWPPRAPSAARSWSRKTVSCSCARWAQSAEPLSLQRTPVDASLDLLGRVVQQRLSDGRGPGGRRCLRPRGARVGSLRRRRTRSVRCWRCRSCARRS